MRVNRSAARRLLPAAAFLFAVPVALSAQKSVCLNGAPRAECSSFMILEAGGLLPIAQTTRPVTWSGQAHEQAAFGDRFHWEIAAGPRKLPMSSIVYSLCRVF